MGLCRSLFDPHDRGRYSVEPPSARHRQWLAHDAARVAAVGSRLSTDAGWMRASVCVAMVHAWRVVLRLEDLLIAVQPAMLA
jgi:hypothetical protein